MSDQSPTPLELLIREAAAAACAGIQGTMQRHEQEPTEAQRKEAAEAEQAARVPEPRAYCSKD